MGILGKASSYPIDNTFLTHAAFFSSVNCGAKRIVQTSFCLIPLVHELIFKLGLPRFNQTNPFESAFKHVLLVALFLKISVANVIRLGTLLDGRTNTGVLLRILGSFLSCEPRG